MQYSNAHVMISAMKSKTSVNSIYTKKNGPYNWIIEQSREIDFWNFTSVSRHVRIRILHWLNTRSQFQNDIFDSKTRYKILLFDANNVCLRPSLRGVNQSIEGRKALWSRCWWVTAMNTQVLTTHSYPSSLSTRDGNGLEDRSRSGLSLISTLGQPNPDRPTSDQTSAEPVSNRSGPVWKLQLAAELIPDFGGDNTWLNKEICWTGPCCTPSKSGLSPATTCKHTWTQKSKM